MSTEEEKRPPRPTKRRWFKAYLEALEADTPAVLWASFSEQSGLPTIRYAFQAASVFSSNIEGNSLDLNSYMLDYDAGGPGGCRPFLTMLPKALAGPPH